MAPVSLPHDEWLQRAAAYALGALDADERAALEAHLVWCAGCREEVRSFDRTVAALACSAPPLEPDVRIRRRIGDLAGRVPLARRPMPAAWWLAAASLAVATAVGAYALGARDAGATRSIVIVLAADDLVRVDLAGQPAAPRASARAFWSRSRGMVFTAAHLPPLPAGRTYQLWIVDGEMPIGAGLLEPGADGAVHTLVSPPRALSRPVAFAVTIEPAGGVASPTGDKYLLGLVN